MCLAPQSLSLAPILPLPPSSILPLPLPLPPHLQSYLRSVLKFALLSPFMFFLGAGKVSPGHLGRFEVAAPRVSLHQKRAHQQRPGRGRGLHRARTRTGTFLLALFQKRNALTFAWGNAKGIYYIILYCKIGYTICALKGGVSVSQV